MFRFLLNTMGRRLCPACSRSVANLKRHLTEYHKLDINVFDAINGNAAKKNTTIEPTPLVDDAICEKFTIWLRSVPGGKKPIKVARQHHRQICIILKYLALYVGSDISLADLTVKNIKMGWLRRVRAPVGTVRSFLSSLLSFVRFLGQIHRENSEHLAKFEYRVSRWSRNLVGR